MAVPALMGSGKRRGTAMGADLERLTSRSGVLGAVMVLASELVLVLVLERDLQDWRERRSKRVNGLNVVI